MAWQFIRPGSRTDRIALILVFPLLFFLVLIAILFSTLYTTAQVEGESMLPGLSPEDRVLVRTSYKQPVHSDVIVFRGGNDVEVVKRVIGLPGDIIEMRAGRALLNGFPETGGYALLHDDADLSHGPYTVPQDSYYVAGDNRPVSLDSRIYGAVPEGRVLGEAILIYWPLSHFGRVDRAGMSD